MGIMNIVGLKVNKKIIFSVLMVLYVSHTYAMFGAKSKTIDVEPESRSILLKDSVVQLNEVVVSTGRIFRKSDRFVFHVPTTCMKNSEELFRQLPGVYMDDKDISIYGSAGTKVFIDEREVKLSGEALIAYLRSLSSSNIKRIEVQPMSDASQSANSKGGIIHIYLRKRTEDGFQSNLILESRVAPSLKDYRPSFSLMGHHRRLDYYASASYIGCIQNKGELDATRNYNQPNYSFLSKSLLSVPSHYVATRANAVYAFDSLRSLGAEVEYISNLQKRNSDNHTIMNIGSLSFESMGHYTQPDQYRLYSATVNYQQKLDQRGSLFKILADYVRKRSTSNSDYHIKQYWISSDTVYRSHLISIYDVASADLSLKKCIQPNNTFVVGIKYTYTDMNDHSNYESWKLQQWSNLPEFAYRLHYTEHIAAGYLTYGTRWNRCSADFGLRTEYTRTVNHDSHKNDSYVDFYPFLTFNYAFDEIQRWMLSCQFARNIERPGFYALNPISIQTSEYNYQIGNPLLKPTYINKVSATLIYDYRYTLTVGCNMHHDLIREFCKQDDENPQVSYITYVNHHRENHWFVNLSAPFQPLVWLNLTNNITAVRQCIQTNPGDAYSNHHLLFIQSVADFRLSSSLSAEWEYNFHNKLYSGNSQVYSHQLLNFALKKKWSGGKWLSTFGVDNIFNEQDKYGSQMDAYIINTAYRLASNGRMFKFVVAWNFNSGVKVKRHLLENSSSNERSRFNK
ncbi:MAG: outer membrane beta-barrel protein [Bacteroidales bacterium]|nr:outer membrane beta-barrel protein [Bacteroidales bacterium]